MSVFSHVTVLCCAIIFIKMIQAFALTPGDPPPPPSMFGRMIIWRCRCQLLREDLASHPPCSGESLEQFPLLSCAGRQIVKFILWAQLGQWYNIEPQTKSSSTRNKTLLKLMNHLVSRTRSFTPASSSPGGEGEGGYGRMTRRGSLSCPSLVQGEPPCSLNHQKSKIFF